MHYGRQMTYVHVSPDLIGVGGMGGVVEGIVTVNGVVG